MPSDARAGAYLDQGELRYRYDTLTRFMRPVIPELTMTALLEETGADFILLVSQLDIVNLGDLVRVNPGKTDFYVRLHYALFGSDGEFVDGGLVSHTLETRTYDPSDIARHEFKFVTQRLYESVRAYIQPAENEEPIDGVHQTEPSTRGN